MFNVSVLAQPEDDMNNIIAFITGVAISSDALITSLSGKSLNVIGACF